jgi:hypothetical protein
MTTVKVESLNNNIIKMTWEQRVTETDVNEAFQKINELLNQSAKPQYVLVDITIKPDFPVMTTVQSALAGPYNNKRLIEWLFVGTNRLARTIEQILGGLTNRRNVRWFTTEADALDYATKNSLTERPKD